MVEVHDVVKHYPSGDDVVRALDGVTMSIAPGESVALYGPSGSGKTTLLMIIAGLLEPDGGSVTVGGHDVTRLSGRESARYRRVDLGYISQTADLMPGVPAVDNAALKLLDMRVGAKEARRRIGPLLERLGLESRRSHAPDQLSAGERQRVQIARALSTDPKVVLADEPTGSLDTRRSREVLAQLTELCSEQGVAMLLVTHDPQAAAFASRVEALSDGKMVEYRPDGEFVGR